MDFNSNTQRLKLFGLPEIFSLEDFSFRTHLSKQTIHNLSVNSEYYYQTYYIKKKSGRLRLIAQPSKQLKGLQAWIQENILRRLRVSDQCKGFEKGMSIVDNARPHVGANVVVNLDIAGFFESIPKARIYGIFRSIGYNSLISTVLTNVCCFRNGLPQGGPCSPKLANLASWRLDVRLQGFVGKRGITYTRYADDLTFSGLHPTKVCKVIPTVRKIMKSEGFSLNEDKSRVSGTTRAKTVTGLVLNDESFGIGKKKYKTLRVKLHKLSLTPKGREGKALFHITGWLAYVKSVDNRRYQKARQFIHSLIAKKPDSALSLLSM